MVRFVRFGLHDIWRGHLVLGFVHVVHVLRMHVGGMLTLHDGSVGSGGMGFVFVDVGICVRPVVPVFVVILRGGGSVHV